MGMGFTYWDIFHMDSGYTQVEEIPGKTGKKKNF